MRDTLRLVGRALSQKFRLRQGQAKILALQRRRLQSLVAWAKKHSPFYARRFREVNPVRFELGDLPVLSKSEMMAHFDDVVTDRSLKLTELERFVSEPDNLGRWYQGRYALSRSSGTQGLKSMIVQSKSMMELLFALQMTRGSVYPVTPAAILNHLRRPARLAVVTIGNGFYPSAVAFAYQPTAARHFIDRLWLKHFEPLSDVVRRLQDFQPTVLTAYANVLEILAREELSGRLNLGCTSRLRQVVNMSEPLSDGARRIIQKAFKAPVMDNYASGECMALSNGCSHGHGMHLNSDWAILEVVDRENRPVPPGTPGEKVLVTNLYNTVQPFIRYELHDVVTMSPVPCPCGNPLPLISKVSGRQDEVTWIREGDHFRQIHPYVFVDALDECPEVGWYQIEQMERNRFQLTAARAPRRHITCEEIHQVMRRGLQRFALAALIQVDVRIDDSLGPDIRTGKLKRIASRIGSPSVAE